MTDHDPDEPVDAELLLEDLAADLVSERRHEPLLTRLFAAEPGVWHDLDALAEGLPLVRDRLAELDALPIHVSWIDLPTSIHGDGYCTITFFCERGHLYRMALYDRGRLDRSRGRPRPPRPPGRLLN